MAPHTKHYHIEDIAADRRHAHLVPGQGAIDFPAVLGEIVRTGYQGWITVELYPYIDDPDAAGRAAKQVLEQAAPISRGLSPFATMNRATFARAKATERPETAEAE